MACSMPCSDQPSQSCGNVNAIQLYTVMNQPVHTEPDNSEFTQWIYTSMAAARTYIKNSPSLPCYANSTCIGSSIFQYGTAVVGETVQALRDLELSPSQLIIQDPGLIVMQANQPVNLYQFNVQSAVNATINHMTAQPLVAALNECVQNDLCGAVSSLKDLVAFHSTLALNRMVESTAVPLWGCARCS